MNSNSSRNYYNFLMEQAQQQKIIIFDEKRPDKQSRKIISIHSTITIHQLRSVVKKQLRLATEYFKLYFHTYNFIFLPLDGDYFEYFVNTLDINKLVKAQQYEPLEKSFISFQPIKQKGGQNHKRNKEAFREINIDQHNLRLIKRKELRNDSIASFFADNILQIAPFFQTLNIDLKKDILSLTDTSSSSKSKIHN